MGCGLRPQLCTHPAPPRVDSEMISQSSSPPEPVPVGQCCGTKAKPEDRTHLPVCSWPEPGAAPGCSAFRGTHLLEVSHIPAIALGQRGDALDALPLSPMP